MCGKRDKPEPPPRGGWPHDYRPSMRQRLFDDIGKDPWRKAKEMRGAVMCGGKNPESDLDDPDYDAFKISRRAKGRKDGWWNQKFVALLFGRVRAA